MKICIFGGGAIGGYLAARLAARSGHTISLIARGAQLAAIRNHGLRLRVDGNDEVSQPQAAADGRELGPQDYVIVTLKAHSVPDAIPALRPLLGPDTTIVTGMNGVPFWYFHRHGGPHDGRVIEAVDPGGMVSQGLGLDRCLGMVVYPAAEVIEPGIVQLIEGDRFSLGEPDGSRSDRALRLSEALIAAGFKAPVRPRIRDEIWVKLWGNLAFNPLSALTHATLDVLATEPDLRAIARAMMVEARAIAEALGVSFAIDVDRRIAGAAAVGAHKTSMLQDLERGRPMEIDALVTAVQELGRLAGIATPMIDTVLALTQARARSAGLYA